MHYKENNINKHIIVFTASICIFMLGIVVLFIGVSPLALAQEDDSRVDLLQYIKEHDLLMSWDHAYNIGLIRKDNTIVSFQPNFPIVLINFTQQRFLSPVIQRNNRFLASKEFIFLLEEVFIEKNQSQEYISEFPNDSVPSVDPDASDNKQVTSPLFPDKGGIQDTIPSLSDKDTGYNTIRDSTFSRVITLVIDPGHGGKAPGAVGRFSFKNKAYELMEKDVVLDVALQVRDKMSVLYPNLNIVMTRSTDEYVSLESRTLIANKYLDQLKEGEAMIFVSIHANAALTSNASGYEVWYLPPDYRRDNLVSEEFSHSQIYTIINNLREEEITLESARLAELVINGLQSKIGTRSINRGVKEEKFYVVRNTKMPAILIELGFVTNAEEGYNLTQASYKRTLSEGIVLGLQNYLKLFDK